MSTEPLIEIRTRTAAQTITKKIRWVWGGFIPLGKITLFVGAPDTGKNLVVLDVAARITTGTPFANCKSTLPPSDVLILGPEDEIEDVVVPRLVSTRADLTKVHYVKIDGAFAQTTALKEALTKNPNIRMVVMDSFLSAFGDGVNSESQLRAVLHPLRDLAHNFNVAIVLITRLTKKGFDATSALTAMARAVWQFQQVDLEKQSFTMTRVKNNLAPTSVLGLNFQIKVHPIYIPVDGELLVPYVVWGERIEPPQSPRPDENVQLREAMTWLQDALQDGGTYSRKLFKDALDAAGITANTLRRAAKALGIKPERLNDGWLWELPKLNATAVTVEEDAEAVETEFELPDSLLRSGTAEQPK